MQISCISLLYFRLTISCFVSKSPMLLIFSYQAQSKSMGPFGFKHVGSTTGYKSLSSCGMYLPQFVNYSAPSTIVPLGQLDSLAFCSLRQTQSSQQLSWVELQRLSTEQRCLPISSWMFTFMHVGQPMTFMVPRVFLYFFKFYLMGRARITQIRFVSLSGVIAHRDLVGTYYELDFLCFLSPRLL